MKLEKERKKVMYRCNGKVPYCGKSMCYKNKNLGGYGNCEHTSDVDYAENFTKAPSGIYYEDDSENTFWTDVFEKRIEKQNKWIIDIVWTIFISAITAILTTLAITSLGL